MKTTPARLQNQRCRSDLLTGHEPDRCWIECILAATRPGRVRSLISLWRMRRDHETGRGTGANSSSRLRLGFAGSVALAAAALFVTGCLGLKPAVDARRYFVLSGLSAADRAANDTKLELGLGVGPVRVPAHLSRNALAIRRHRNEIVYSAIAQWSEPLDVALTQVLGANLAVLLDTPRIHLDAWSRGAVDYEVHVAVARFEPDEDGCVELVARYRVHRPGEREALRASQLALRQQGPPPGRDPEGSIAAMSEMIAELSREVARVLRELAGPGTGNVTGA